MGSVEWWFVAAFVVIFVGLPLWQFIRSRFTYKAAQKEGEKSEALFKTMFPELQPHFHPSSVVDYVIARIGKGKKFAGPWQPRGFSAAATAILEQTPKGERTILKDAAGATIGEFLFDWGDKSPTVGIVRVGKGKFRVKHRAGKVPWASYWHPDREFDWRGPKLWTFRSHVADDSISSTDHGTSWSSDSRSSTSSTATAAAATAGVVAAGGTFDGGGASAGWDGPSDSSSGSSSSSSSSSSDFGDVSSGSSSTTSTGY